MKLFASILAVLLHGYTLFFALSLLLACITLIWVTGFQWWSFAIVFLIAAALIWATRAAMKARRTR